jgi:multidrug efflux pump
MNISAPFIRRPVATTLLTLGIAMAGFLAFLKLPVAPLPQVDFPTISVSGQLPGASPETVATSVAEPLERHLGQIADVTEMTSQSGIGQTRITLQFQLNRDIDGAARDVQAAINAATADLPTSLKTMPTYRKVNPADAPILILAMTSKTLTQGQMYDAASNVFQQQLSQISGIGQVIIGGSALPAVRVELNPEALFKYGVGLEDVRAALASANANSPKGIIDDGGRRYQIYTNDQATKAADYAPLVIAYRNGSPIRLSDVAAVEDSVEDVRNLGLSNGQPSVLVILFRQPGANIIDTIDSVKAELPHLQAAMPADVNVTIAIDRSTTIRQSLSDTEVTLLIAVGLVTIVVYFFLRHHGSGGRGAGLHRWHFRGDVSSQLQSRHPVADGADHRHRLRGRRRYRRLGEHLAAYGGRNAAHAGGTPRRARGRLHGPFNQPVADRRVHPRPADGRHPRPVVS